MISNYCSEIKIAMFQSISECQGDKWRSIVKLRTNRGKNRANPPNYCTRVDQIFTSCVPGCWACVGHSTATDDVQPTAWTHRELSSWWSQSTFTHSLAVNSSHCLQVTHTD